MNIRNVLKKIDGIKDNKMYTMQEIKKMQVFFDSTGKPSMFIVYRIIGKGIIKAMNVSTGAVPRYLVKGSELKKELRRRYSTYEKPSAVPEKSSKSGRTEAKIKK
jgi:hypothetical protein